MAYLPLSTANLPDPVIDPAQGASPEDYFNPVLYTGDNGTQSITGVGFQPDLLWIKVRNFADSNVIQDVLRQPTGGGKYPFLKSDSTAAEAVQTDNDSVHSLDADGFTVGYTNSPAWNNSGKTYVAWNWKANGSGVTNNVGSITSTVSANTTSGFSIVSYTGNSTAGATVGHGLDATPDMFIVKNRDRSADWHIYHTDLGATKNLKFTTASVATQAGVFNNTEPTSTVFSLGTNSALNASGEDIIAYCFHSVEGFSKFGSYVGNDSGDGNFIYTGFSPALIVIKYASGSAGGTKNWYVWDNARSPQNVNDNILYWNSAGSEGGDSAFDIDRLSNGFKLRNAEGGVNNAATYIYMAFAENPFKYSNAR